MGKRKAEEHEWGIFKDEIISLRRTHSVSEVRQRMCEKGFNRTAAQYERQLNKWQDGAPKNVKELEWKYFFQQQKQRAEEGKSSAVTVRGYKVPQSRIDKQRRKHTHQTALQRYAPEARATTPPGVEVYTPRGQSPTLDRIQSILQFMKRLPYRLFNDRLDKVLSLHRESSFPTLSINLTPFLGRYLHTKEYTPLNLLLGNNSTNASSAISIKPASYLPTIPSSVSPNDHVSNSNLAVRGSQLELLKYVIGLLSNGHDDGLFGEALERLAEDPRNLSFLTRLFSMKQDSVSAFAEKLLPKAIRQHWSPALVTALLSSGVNVNCVDTFGHTLLVIACQVENNAVIELLLEHGVDVNSPDHRGFSPLYYASARSDDVVAKLLDRGSRYGDILPSIPDVVDTHHEELAERLLQCIVTSSAYAPTLMISAFIETAYRGDVDTLDRLARLQPETFGQLKRTPWLLFEAASFFNSKSIHASKSVGSWASGAVAVIGYLQNHGFDPTAVDEYGRGNPLVYAVLQGDITLIQYLLDAGASVHTFANGSWKSSVYHPIFDNEYEFWEEQTGKDMILNGLFANGLSIAPIHAAAGNILTLPLKTDIVQLLLDTGADPNQPGSAYPIQIASWSDDEGVGVVKTLLNAGARPDLTSPETIRVRYIDDFDDFDEDEWDGEFKLKIRLPTALHLASNVAVFDALIGAGATFPDPHYTKDSCTCEDDVFEREPYISSLFDSQITGTSTRSAAYTYEELISSEASHDPDSEECPCSFEFWWNPLYRTAHYGRQDLLTNLITILSPLQRQLWLTDECFSVVVRSCNWDFVAHHMGIGTFPKDCVHQTAFLIRAVREQQECWVSRLAKEGKLSKTTLTDGFVEATNLIQQNLIPIFLEAGCWPDTHGSKNSSPLEVALEEEMSDMIAVFSKHYETNLYRVNELVVSTHFAQAYGQAIKYGSLVLAKFLRRGTSLDRVEFRGDVLHWKNRYTEIRSSVQLAVMFRQYEIAKWLLDEGADPNISRKESDHNDAYNSPIQCAAEHGNINLVQDLLDKGADVNHPPVPVLGATALQFAAILGNLEMATILLRAGADINAPPCSWAGRSAIEGAAERGRLDMVCFLLEAGAAVQGRTNLDYRRTVYRAWVHGHRVLANVVQRWKQEKYGLADCETTETIIESMDLETLGRYEDSALEEPDCEICRKGYRR